MVLRSAVLTSHENLLKKMQILGPHLTPNQKLWGWSIVICIKNSPDDCDKCKYVKITEINSSYYVLSLTPG